jgi:hypothetical protein
VIPTLVAVSVAPTKTASSGGCPNQRMTAKPSARERYAHDGDQRGLEPRPQQLAEVGFQPHLEQEDEDTEFRQAVKPRRLVHEAQDTGSDDHSGQQLAEDGCLAEALHRLACRLGNEPDHGEADEQFSELHCQVAPRSLTRVTSTPHIWSSPRRPTRNP